VSNGTSERLDKVLAHATVAGRPSGSILRLERLALRIDQKALARQMGMSRQGLDLVERREKVAPAMVERYRAALLLIVTIAPADARGVTLAKARDKSPDSTTGGVDK
jgi:transcriptional regulator with XRE-family HTH domain